MIDTPRIRQAFDDLVIAIREQIVGQISGVAVERAPISKSGNKRQPTEIEAATHALLTAIKRTPGLRIDQLAKELGSTPKDLQLPAAKLLDSKSVKRKGQRRGTTYYPAGR